MNWNRFSLFKLPKEYRRFDFAPRYYDERKEALRKKIAEYEAVNDSADAAQVRREVSFRANAGERWGNSEFKTQSMRANVRLILILGVVLAVFYYIFRGLDFLGPALDSIKK